MSGKWVFQSAYQYAVMFRSYLYVTNRKPNKHSCLIEGFAASCWMTHNKCVAEVWLPCRCNIRAFVVFSKNTLWYSSTLNPSCRIDAWNTLPAGNCKLGKVKGQQEMRGVCIIGQWACWARQHSWWLMLQCSLSVPLFVSVGWLSNLMAGIMFCWVRSLAVSLRALL